MYLSRRKLLALSTATALCLLTGIGVAVHRWFHQNLIYQVVAQAHPSSPIYARDYQSGVSVSSRAAILMDASTGTVLFGKNEQQRRDPASTTKIVTALLAIELGRPDDVVTISKRAAWTSGSSLGLQPGQKIKLSELLTGTMLLSGNDGAVAIAEHIAGSITEFGRMMTLRAAQLGALGSNFRNPHGLTAVNHYTTAYDLAIITRHALQYPEFREVVSTREDIVTYEDGKQQPVQNTNKLLWQFYGADGVKTGTTSAAGQCLVGSATRDSWQLISVVLNSGSRWNDSAKLLQYGFNTFERKPIVSAGVEVGRLPVANGAPAQVAIEAGSDLVVVVRKEDADVVRICLDVPDALEAPVRKGTTVGKLVAMIEDSEVGSVDLVAAESARRKGLIGFILSKIAY